MLYNISFSQLQYWNRRKLENLTFLLENFIFSIVFHFISFSSKFWFVILFHTGAHRCESSSTKAKKYGELTEEKKSGENMYAFCSFCFFFFFLICLWVGWYHTDDLFWGNCMIVENVIPARFERSAQKEEERAKRGRMSRTDNWNLECSYRKNVGLTGYCQSYVRTCTSKSLSCEF